MGKDQLSRKLAVILHADVVSSTSLVLRNETVANARNQAAFNSLSEIIKSYAGVTREIRGVAIVAEFERASDAVTATIAFQAANTESNTSLGDSIQSHMRIGISMGEVVIANNTITGAGVVLAQRLEQLADSGGVVVKGSVSETVPSRMPFVFESLGEQILKGFDKPVSAFTAKLRRGEEMPLSETVASRNDTDSSESRIVDSPTVAVLPFTNMSDDSGLEYFCDGRTEDIITVISRTRWHKVTSRKSTFAFKNASLDVREITATLGADNVLKGSFRKSNN